MQILYKLFKKISNFYIDYIIVDSYMRVHILKYASHIRKNLSIFKILKVLSIAPSFYCVAPQIQKPGYGPDINDSLYY